MKAFCIALSLILSPYLSAASENECIQPNCAAQKAQLESFNKMVSEILKKKLDEFQANKDMDSLLRLLATSEHNPDSVILHQLIKGPDYCQWAKLILTDQEQKNI